MTLYGLDFTSLNTNTPLLVRVDNSNSFNLTLLPVHLFVIIEINSCLL